MDHAGRRPAANGGWVVYLGSGRGSGFHRRTGPGNYVPGATLAEPAPRGKARHSGQTRPTGPRAFGQVE